MALVSDNWYVSVTLADNGNNRGSLEFQCDPAVVTDSITANAQALLLVSALSDITNGVITAYSVREGFVENALVLPPSGVELNTKASISFTKAGDGKLANLKFPTPTNVAGVVFVSDSGGGANVVQTNSAFLATYFDLFRAGGGFMISDGEKANLIIKGKRIGAKSNNG